MIKKKIFALVSEEDDLLNIARVTFDKEKTEGNLEIVKTYRDFIFKLMGIVDKEFKYTTYEDRDRYLMVHYGVNTDISECIKWEKKIYEKKDK